MEILTLTLPAMYGDHHVIEVRRILLALPGIEAVYASSCFQVVQTAYEPGEITEKAIRAKLEEAGYLQDLTLPVETGAAGVASDGQNTYFRHTVAYQQTGRVVGFAQNVSDTGRVLWPCPGMGVIRVEEDSNGKEGA